ncbi:type VII secretion protein EssB [Peribacillus kribbensis]|uniref:type VII secretion protein EssB n=1 Tax=Peribacillus kribbensis TaxID=356658 RepID=UPI000426E2CB|nr:type VII secretion protein EssB [Peribacillus kribbensis]
MEGTKQSYLEEQLDALIKKDGSSRNFIFQRSRVKLRDALEIKFLEGLDSDIKKEIIVNEDEVVVRAAVPPSFLTFAGVKKKTRLARLYFAHQLVEKVIHHDFSRLHVIVSPENILADPGLSPHFLHYGVKESLPPYEKDEERLLKETRAACAELADDKYTFADYIQFSQTLKLSNQAKEIMAIKTFEELSDYIGQAIRELEQKESNYAYIPKKKWNIYRYALLGASILLIPAIIYILSFLLFTQPKQEAYVKSGQYYLEQKYSQVIDTLNQYDPEDMPYAVQYELASSYIKNEELGEEQRDAVENMVTLQTDPQYFLYWINIGRGKNKEAVDLARSMEFRDLVIYGLIKYKDDIKADDKLTGEEKEKELNSIDQEVAEYQKDLKEQKKQEDEEKAAEESGTPGAAQGAGGTQPVQTAPAGTPQVPVKGAKAPAVPPAAPKKEEKPKAAS